MIFSFTLNEKKLKKLVENDLTVEEYFTLHTLNQGHDTIYPLQLSSLIKKKLVTKKDNVLSMKGHSVLNKITRKLKKDKYREDFKVW